MGAQEKMEQEQSARAEAEVEAAAAPVVSTRRRSAGNRVTPPRDAVITRARARPIAPRTTRLPPLQTVHGVW